MQVKEPVLRLEHVNKCFGRRQVLTDVSLSLSSGEVHAYLGPNGAGKTTTIKIILNLLIPDSGQVEIFGHDVVRNFEAVKSLIGGVSAEKPYLFMSYTLKTNLQIFGELHGLKGQKLRSRIDEVVSLFRLEERVDIPIARMSAGEQIKASFCRALLHDPPLLILDEPTASMDVPSAGEVRHLLMKLSHEEGKTVFLATHNMIEAQQLADTVSFLDRGRIQVQGPTEQVLATLAGGEKHLRVICANPKAACESLKNSVTLQKQLITDIRIEEHAVVLTLHNNESLNDPLMRIASATEIYEVVTSTPSFEDLFLNRTGKATQEARH